MKCPNAQTVSAVIAALCLVGAVPVFADDDSSLDGSVEIVWRNVDVSGNEERYEEDFDGLASGARLGNLSLNWVNPDPSGIDYARLRASGLGGDPFEYSSLRIGASSKWDLSFVRRKQEYFYNLFEFTDDEDGHSWETRRESNNINLRLHPRENLRVDFGLKQTDRTGNSMTMKDISRDIFVLDAPVDNTRRDLSVGVSGSVGEHFDYLFRQTRRSFENHIDQATEGNLGEDTAGPTLLTNYDWAQREDSDADFTQVMLRGAAGRVDASLSYYGTLLGAQELDTRIDTSAVGVDFAGAPLTITNGFGDTTTERDIQYLNLDVAVAVVGPLNLIFQADSMEWDQSSTGQLDLSGTGTPSTVNNSYSYKIDTLTALAEVIPTKRLNIRIGGRTIDRETVGSGFGTGLDGVFKSDGDQTIVAEANWRTKRVGLSAGYEEGDVDNPLNPLSLFDSERTRLRASFKPRDGMKIEATHVEAQNANSSGVLGSEFDSSTSALSFSGTSEKWNCVLRYSVHDVDTQAQVIFDTPAFGGPAAVDNGIALYTSDSDQWRAMVRYGEGRWHTYLRIAAVDSKGGSRLDGTTSGNIHITPIDQDYFDTEMGVTYSIPTGAFVGASWRRADYEDVGNRALQYDSTIVSLRAGFRFGKTQ